MTVRTALRDIAGAIIFALTIVGTNILDISESVGLTTILGTSAGPGALVLLLSGSYVWFVRRRKPDEFTFNEKSRRFYKFFAKWYSKDGQLSIYCSDLQWLAPNGDRRTNEAAKKVVKALQNKGKDLHLYLRNRASDEVASLLVEGGAKYTQIGSNIVTNHRMSIIDYSGFKRIIIRDVHKDDPNRIVFKETNIRRDPIIISLALDLLDDCDR